MKRGILAALAVAWLLPNGALAQNLHEGFYVEGRGGVNFVQEIDVNDDMALYGVYRTKLILGLAMLEGMAFFNIVACIMEHNWWSLALAGCLIVWMLMAFPSQGRVERWIETQRMNLGFDDFNEYRFHPNFHFVQLFF